MRSLRGLRADDVALFRVPEAAATGSLPRVPADQLETRLLSLRPLLGPSLGHRQTPETNVHHRHATGIHRKAA